MANIHYIWIDFENANGSVHSKLVYNGEMEATAAAEAMDKISKERQLQLKPRWMKDVKKIELSAQTIEGDVRYRTTTYL